MEKSFWESKWVNDEIGFHQNEINVHLIKYIKLIKNDQGNILVPLCGKSKDLLYLTQHFNKVIGIEVVKKAVSDFYKENIIKFETNNNRYQS